MNVYFDLFQLPAIFAIDEQQLNERYHQLATQWHPDKFVASSSFEQKQAMMMSTTINEAYRTLSNPTDRAAYLLRLRGIDADAPEHTSFAPEFLMQQMEWREQLAEAHADGNEAALLALQADIQQVWQDTLKIIAQCFEQGDFEQMSQKVRHCRFLNKLQQEIRAVLP